MVRGFCGEQARVRMIVLFLLLLLLMMLSVMSVCSFGSLSVCLSLRLLVLWSVGRVPWISAVAREGVVGGSSSELAKVRIHRVM